MGKTPRQTVVIGLLGGVCSGKSLVAELFAQLGARVISADKIGHQVLELPQVKAQLVERWGRGILRPDGSVDRKAVADIVFASTEKAGHERRFLESITHPLITERAKQLLEQARQDGVQAVVLDAPLLLEAGWDKLCNVLVFVDACRQIRQARASCRGWNLQQLANREAAQIPLDQKRRLADYVIDNSGSEQETRAQVERIWRVLFDRG